MEKLQKLQQLIEACRMRANLHSRDLFSLEREPEKNYNELTKKITALTKELSVIGIRKYGFSEAIEVQVYEKDFFDEVDAPVENSSCEKYIHYSKEFTLELPDGKIMQHIKLVYLVNLEEHKKTQTI